MHPDAFVEIYFIVIRFVFTNILREKALEILSFVHCDNVRKEFKY